MEDPVHKTSPSTRIFDKKNLTRIIFELQLYIMPKLNVFKSLIVIWIEKKVFSYILSDFTVVRPLSFKTRLKGFSLKIARGLELLF